MRVSAEVFGYNKLAEKIENLTPRVKKEVFNEIVGGVLRIHADAVKSIQAQGSSLREEIRYNPKRKVRVSRPGEPPNADTGRLIKSIEFDFDKTNLSGKVGTNLRYGAWLEFGTLTMAAHPWLRPAYEKNIQGVADAIQEAFAEGIRKK